MRFFLIFLTLFVGSAAQALELSELEGRVEVRSASGWVAAKIGLLTGSGSLRTLVGQLTLEEGGGRLKLGSRSSLELKSNEPALTDGQAYVQGPLVGFVNQVHFRLERGSRARVDLTGPRSRLAVLEGKVNLYGGGFKNLNVGVGKSLNLLNRVQSDFVEDAQPWYLEKLSGLGAVRLEAFKGLVELQTATTWQTMQKGDSLEGEGSVRTGAASWAELGFEGGGYLRLGAAAHLKVLAVEKLASGGRKVTLLLEQGSAWNVVGKGKGNYELRTATLVAGVRGTVFRVDADGLLKVLEGEVAASTKVGEQPVPSGQQVQNGQKESLVLDATDRFDLERDRLRSLPFTLEGTLPSATPKRDFTLELRTNFDSEVSLKLGGQTVKLTPNPGGVVRYQPLLPEGETLLELTVTHYDQSKTLAGRFQIDRTAPQFTALSVRREGLEGVLKLRVEDASPLTVRLSRFEGANTRQNLTFSGSLTAGELRFPWASGPLEIRVEDAADNVTVQILELDSSF